MLTWDSVSGWPTVGDFPIRLDSVDGLTTEIVLCTSVNVGANQTTVTRAQEGTSASGLFVINSTGGNDLTAQMLTDAIDNVLDIDAFNRDTRCAATGPQSGPAGPSN